LFAVIASGLFSLLTFMSVSQGAATVFNWFQSLTTVGGFFSWASINLTYIFFYRGLKAQGIDRSTFSYHNPFQPYLAYWGVSWNVFFILINGFEVFWDFTAAK
jgi:amino acid transporter